MTSRERKSPSAGGRWGAAQVALLLGWGLAGCRAGGEPPAAQPRQDRVVTPAPLPAGSPPPGGGADCDVDVTGPAVIPRGMRSAAQVVLRPRGRFEVNQDAPIVVRVWSPSLVLSKTRFGVEDATVLAPDEVAIEVPFSSDVPGRHRLEVHGHFGMCGGDACALCRKSAELATVVN